MNYKELLFNKDNVLSFYPRLAVIFNDFDEIEKKRIEKETGKTVKADRNGLGKAIVLNQINYWIEINKKSKKNYRDGYYWTYNSYANWANEDFPYWSADTIERIFASLVKLGVLIAANYNKQKFDKTKWYRIDCDRLQEIIDTVEKQQKDSADDNKENHCAESNTATCGNDDRKLREEKGSCPNDDRKLRQSYNIYNNINTSTEITTKTTTDITSKDYSTKNTRTEEEKEKVGTDVPTQKKGGQAAPYIVLPDTEESKPHPADDKFHRGKIERMVDSCEVRARSELGYDSRSANILRDCLNYFCKTYEKRTGYISGYVCGDNLMKVIQFMIDEFQKGNKSFYETAKEQIDKFFDERSSDKDKCQITDFVNERRTA